ncbi:MAG: tetratricopeptide repeat protein [Gemmataceae bacterium]
MRGPWFWLSLMCLGCHSLTPVEVPEEKPCAKQLWQQGQEAMRQGQPEQAIAHYQNSLAQKPDESRNYLSLAAAYLEKGDDAGACLYLARYVAAHPDLVQPRCQLAELLIRLRRYKDARHQLEQAVALAQDQTDEKSLALQIRCHARLMEIAEMVADNYHRRLHRGIGLYLMAHERATLPDPDGELPVEMLWCKAARELQAACIYNAEEARPKWYLYQTLLKIAPSRSARPCLDAAQAAAPYSYLTPAERRDLHLACRCDKQ